MSDLPAGPEYPIERAQTEDPPPHDGYGPGSFSLHEALHVVTLVEGLVDRELAEHPAIQANPEWAMRVDTVCVELAKLYQEIGTAHLA